MIKKSFDKAKIILIRETSVILLKSKTLILQNIWDESQNEWITDRIREKSIVINSWRKRKL